MRRGLQLLQRLADRASPVSDAVLTGRWFRAAASSAAVGTSQSHHYEADYHRWSWFGAVTAAAACYAAQPGPVQCEANEQGGWTAMSHGVRKIWQHLDEDLHREDALLSTPFADWSRPEPPTLRLSSGRFSLTFPVRAGVEVSSVMTEIAKQFGIKKGQDTAQSTFEVEDRRHIKVYTFTPEEEAESKPKDESQLISVQVHIPRNSLFSLPHVELHKQGVFTTQELDRFAAVLKVANQLPPDNSQHTGNPAACHVQPEKSKLAVTQQVQTYSYSTQLGDNRQAEFDPARLFQRLQDAAVGSLLDELEGSFPEMGTNMRKLFRPDDDDRLDDEGRIHSQSVRLSPVMRQKMLGRDDSDKAPHEEEKFEYGSKEADQAVQKLQELGAIVHPPGNKESIDWGMLAGYASQKQDIEDTMLLALLRPEVYDRIAQGTRHTFASNKPRAVLFEGPPGTGKTTSARVIASQASVPLVYVPLEAVGSKWYGESERNLSDMFKAAEALPGCIIFLDEVDSLATSRGSEMHEATRRLLGVLLRHLDGFESNKRSVVIAATNRKQDLDPALLSRFNISVEFGLPDEACRAEILKLYAKHLSDEEVGAVAAATIGLAGRDLKDLSEQAERRWASKIIRELETGELPPVAEYLVAAKQRLKEIEAAQKRRQLPFSF